MVQIAVILRGANGQIVAFRQGLPCFPRIGRAGLGHCAILRGAKGRAMASTRKIAAILVADVVGYSRLAGTDEERTLAGLLPCILFSWVKTAKRMRSKEVRSWKTPMGVIAAKAILGISILGNENLRPETFGRMGLQFAPETADWRAQNEISRAKRRKCRTIPDARKLRQFSNCEPVSDAFVYFMQFEGGAMRTGNRQSRGGKPTSRARQWAQSGARPRGVRPTNREKYRKVRQKWALSAASRVRKRYRFPRFSESSPYSGEQGAKQLGTGSGAPRSARVVAPCFGQAHRAP